MKDKIQLIKNESEDYKIIKLNDEEIFRGSEIPDSKWIYILTKIGGIDIEVNIISDEDMEVL